MGLDTKYRPRRYGEVVGQEGIIRILRQYVKDRTQFHQSYLFVGPHGSGKTTIGRILARALLCESPKEGNPCDECSSCQAMLLGHSTDAFIEVDAATNSGKAEIQKIIEELQYGTFRGDRRIYLFDEAHQLSKGAKDALLKPTEDNIPGTEDKLLVCIFCTTEPHKMPPTIASRCARPFIIKKPSIEAVSDRLAYVGETEGYKFDRAALRILAEVSECHLRDALKCLEGCAGLGDVDIENAKMYLGLGATPLLFDVLLALGKDLKSLLQATESLRDVVAPATCYDFLSVTGLELFKLSMGIGSAPSYWAADVVQTLQDRAEDMLEVSLFLAQRPNRVPYSTLVCDLIAVHDRLCGGIKVRSSEPTEVVGSKTGFRAVPSGIVKGVESPLGGTSAPYVTPSGVFLDPSAIRRGDESHTPAKNNGVAPLNAEQFAAVLCRCVMEFQERDRVRPVLQRDVGYVGTHQARRTES